MSSPWFSLLLVIFNITEPAAALNPIEPSTLCDRFIQDQDKKQCERQAIKLDLDWYAASVCDLLDSDSQFLKCWTEVDGKIYSPPDLIDCVSEDLVDEDRRACLRRVSKKDSATSRVPAAEGKAKGQKPAIFQPLNIKK